MTSKLPPTASVAKTLSGDKLTAPAAERNVAALTDLLTRVAPSAGRALEIASGTGQHIVHFAQALPSLQWTPSDIAPERLASIAAYRAQARLPNLQDPVYLDGCSTGWSRRATAFDLILTINLLHLISERAAATLITETANALSANGTLMIYGPFLRNGQTTSDGDARFHEQLQFADPEIGYKDRDSVKDWAKAAGLLHVEGVDMPANNLALIFRKLYAPHQRG